MRKGILAPVLGACCLIGLSACSSPPQITPAPTQPPTPASRPSATMAKPGQTPLGGYPARPTVVIPTAGYPLAPRPTTAGPNAGAYPAPVQKATDAFALDLPLKSGQTQVTGKGPAGVNVLVIDSTLMGSTLGKGQIGADGRFTVQVKPLPGTHRVGIMIADPGTSGKSEQDFYNGQYYGPGGQSIPQVGNIMTSGIVQQ